MAAEDHNYWRDHRLKKRFMPGGTQAVQDEYRFDDDIVQTPETPPSNDLGNEDEVLSAERARLERQLKVIAPVPPAPRRPSKHVKLTAVDWARAAVIWIICGTIMRQWRVENAWIIALVPSLLALKSWRTMLLLSVLCFVIWMVFAH